MSREITPCLNCGVRFVYRTPNYPMEQANICLPCRRQTAPGYTLGEDTAEILKILLPGGVTPTAHELRVSGIPAHIKEAAIAAIRDCNH